ncbi:MAG: PAS domain S-box protein, partial [Armatimonadetes bacterium]|nr:PAS domain S-box protein [Armatimonadota bacterium]
SDEATALRCLQAGAADYVPKEHLVRIAPAVTGALEKRKAGEKLRQSEEHFRSLIENALDIISVLEVDGTVRYVSPSAERILGYRPEELLGKNVSDLVHPGDLRKVKEVLMEGIRNPGTTGSVEFRVRTTEGGWSHQEALGRAGVDEAGATIVVINSRDVTERKQAEESLRASKEYATSLIESSLDMIIAVDRDRKIIEFNRAAQEAFGYLPEEVLGKSVDLLYADPEEGRHVHLTTVESGRCVQEIRNLRKNGEVFPTLLAASVLRNSEGEVVGVMGISRDVTEQRSLERQLLHSQKMQSIGTLAGGIAHDFNNLLTGIIGYAELARGEVEPGKEPHQYLNIIVEQGMRAASLVSQLLQFSRQEKTERRPLELTPLVKETVEILQRTLPESLTIRLEAPQGIAPVKGDPAQVQQVILNLCVNASHAMPEGGDLDLGLENVLLDDAYCRRYPFARSGSYVCLSVRDTGVGMPPEVQERIFEPFFTTKELGQGTGLGLAMVYGIAKSHEGHITVESEVNKGSTFRVYLPTVEGPSPQPSNGTSPLPRGSETLLLVEDDPSVLQVGKALLQNLGYTVLTAVDGEEALEVYRHFGKDVALVLTDLVMPRMSGDRMCEVLIRIDPEVKVVVMSGHSRPEGPGDLKIPGMKAWMEKPLTMNVLAHTVRDALEE